MVDMAKKSRTTFKKRQKEMARQQRQKDKMARRVERKERSAEMPPVVEGEDPQIAGIQPGPQPLPDEWNYVPPLPRREDSSGEGDS
jgi:hypothetical protein